MKAFCKILSDESIGNANYEDVVFATDTLTIAKPGIIVYPIDLELKLS
ncbi:unnamed protein product [marine sediment metagenome]|uniref:Uncharacterized protein n=1 Tax=marine sediment metagenome TaxID=412755 RepID=X1MB19_9ZZZZ